MENKKTMFNELLDYMERVQIHNDELYNEWIKGVVDENIRTLLNMTHDETYFCISDELFSNRFYKYIFSLKNSVSVIRHSPLFASYKYKNSNAYFNENSAIEIYENVYMARMNISYKGNMAIDYLIVFKHFEKWNRESFKKFFIDFSKRLYEFDSLNKCENKIYNNLVLPNNIKEDMFEDIEHFLASKDEYEKMSIPWKRGYMLIGDPGLGKTMLIKAVEEKYGVVAENFKDLIKGNKVRIGSQKNTIDGELFPFKEFRLLVLEDIDKFVTMQSGNGHEDSGSVQLHEILRALDGVEENDGYIIIATTNYPKQLQEAIINRPGRFDRQYIFKKPEIDDICKLFEVHNVTIEPNVEEVANKLKGLSMAQIMEVIISAKMTFKKNNFTIEEVRDIIDRVKKYNDNYNKNFDDKKGNIGLV